MMTYSGMFIEVQDSVREPFYYFSDEQERVHLEEIRHNEEIDGIKDPGLYQIIFSYTRHGDVRLYAITKISTELNWAPPGGTL